MLTIHCPFPTHNPFDLAVLHNQQGMLLEKSLRNLLANTCFLFIKTSTFYLKLKQSLCIIPLACCNTLVTLEIPLCLCYFHIVFVRITCLQYQNFGYLVKNHLLLVYLMPEQISQIFVIFFSEAVCVSVLLTSARTISLCLCGNHFFNTTLAVLVKNIIEVNNCDLKLGSERVVGLD